jgi:hypothetical protein
MEVIEMTRKIICRQGRCYDPNTLGARFNKVHAKRDFVDQIEYDLLMDELDSWLK